MLASEKATMLALGCMSCKQSADEKYGSHIHTYIHTYMHIQIYVHLNGSNIFIKRRRMKKIELLSLGEKTLFLWWNYIIFFINNNNNTFRHPLSFNIIIIIIIILLLFYRLLEHYVHYYEMWLNNLLDLLDCFQQCHNRNRMIFNDSQ